MHVNLICLCMCISLIYTNPPPILQARYGKYWRNKTSLWRKCTFTTG